MRNKIKVDVKEHRGIGLLVRTTYNERQWSSLNINSDYDLAEVSRVITQYLFDKAQRGES